MSKTLIQILERSITEYNKEMDELMIEVKYSENYNLGIEYKLDRVNMCKGAIEALTTFRKRFKD